MTLSFVAALLLFGALTLLFLPASPRTATRTRWVAILALAAAGSLVASINAGEWGGTGLTGPSP